MKTLKTRLLALVLLTGLFSQSYAFAAANQAQALRGRADSYMKSANFLYKQSTEMLKSSPTSDMVRSAMALITSSGQLFEMASLDYKALLSKNVSRQADIDAALQGKKVCIETLQQIRANTGASRRRAK